MTDKEIERKVKSLKEEISKSEREIEKLRFEHIRNCIEALNDITWMSTDKGLSRSEVSRMQRITTHILNFVSGAVRDTYADFSGEVNEIRKERLEK